VPIILNPILLPYNLKILDMSKMRRYNRLNDVIIVTVTGVSYFKGLVKFLAYRRYKKKGFVHGGKQICQYSCKGMYIDRFDCTDERA